VGSEHLDVLPDSHLPPPRQTCLSQTSLTATCHLLTSTEPHGLPPHRRSYTRARPRGKETRHTAHGTRGANDGTACAAAHAPDLHVPISTWPSTWWKQSVRGTWAANARRQQCDALASHGTLVTLWHHTRAWALAPHSFLDLAGSFLVPAPSGKLLGRSRKATCLDHVASAGNRAARHTTVLNSAQRQDPPQMSDPSNRGSGGGQTEEERARPFLQTPGLPWPHDASSCQHRASDVNAGHRTC
jgi:hypothetical protein